MQRSVVWVIFFIFFVYKVIVGNQIAFSTTTYFFKEPFITQVVRIYPDFHSTPVCLRMELYGCDPNPGNDITHATRQLSFFQKNQINSLLLRVDMETFKLVRSNMKQDTIQITTTALTNQTVGRVNSSLLRKRSGVEFGFIDDKPRGYCERNLIGITLAQIG